MHYNLCNKIAECLYSAEPEIQRFGKDSVSAESDFEGSAKVRIRPKLILPGSVHHYSKCIIDQFGRKRCQKKRKDMEFKLLSEFFPKIFSCTRAVGYRKFVQYIRMLYTGRFILAESVQFGSYH